MSDGVSPARTRLAIDARVLDDRYHGIGRVTFELINALIVEDRFELVLFFNSSQRSERYDLAPVLSHPLVHKASFDHAVSSPLQYVFWPAALRKARVDCVLFPYHIGAALVSRPRRYAIIHDCIFESNAEFALDRRASALYKILTRVVTRTSTILTPSKASADELTRYYGVDIPAAHIIKWGVGQNFATPAVEHAHPLTLTAADRSWEFAPADRYVLHVGAHRPHKNVQVLIRTLALLPPDVKLVLVGSTDQRWLDSNAELCQRLGVTDRVLHVDKVSEQDLRWLYQNATAFMYPSLVEGFGLPLLEAMAAGAPVIASRIPVFTEIAEGAALFADPEKPEEWSAAFELLQDTDIRERHITSGRERAERTTWAQAGHQLALALRPRGR